MTKYKTMLQLRHFSNLPTIKNLELKNNNTIMTFDNFEITSVKSAINEILKQKQQKAFKKLAIFKFTTQYINLKDNTIFKISEWDKETGYNNMNYLLDFKKHFLNINNKDNVEMLGEYYKDKDIFEKVPCKMVTTCKIELKRVKTIGFKRIIK